MPFCLPNCLYCTGHIIFIFYQFDNKFVLLDNRVIRCYNVMISKYIQILFFQKVWFFRRSYGLCNHNLIGPGVFISSRYSFDFLSDIYWIWIDSNKTGRLLQWYVLKAYTLYRCTWLLFSFWVIFASVLVGPKLQNKIFCLSLCLFTNISNVIK